MTERPHGRNRYSIDGCRCDVCREDVNQYKRWLNRERAYGRPRRVPAGPVRDHVNELRAHGMGFVRIAKAAGVQDGVVTKLLYGIPSAGRAPSRTLFTGTAAKILAVRLDLADGALTDSRPARRRLQALVANGWSMAKLAYRLGMKRTNIARLISSCNPVTVATDRRIRALYTELWDAQPPETRLEDRVAATKSRNLAQRKGWRLPMWWDDERLDDPTPTDEERPEVVRHMLGRGASLRQIQRTIRADMKTIHKILQSEQLYDQLPPTSRRAKSHATELREAS